MGTMGMVIRRGLGELGPFLFVVRRRAPVFGIQVRGLGDIVFLRALLLLRTRLLLAAARLHSRRPIPSVLQAASIPTTYYGGMSSQSF